MIKAQSRTQFLVGGASAAPDHITLSGVLFNQLAERDRSIRYAEGDVLLRQVAIAALGVAAADVEEQGDFLEVARNDADDRQLGLLADADKVHLPSGDGTNLPGQLFLAYTHRPGVRGDGAEDATAADDVNAVRVNVVLLLHLVGELLDGAGGGAEGFRIELPLRGDAGRQRRVVGGREQNLDVEAVRPGCRVDDGGLDALGADLDAAQQRRAGRRGRQEQKDDQPESATGETRGLLHATFSLEILRDASVPGRNR